MSLISVAVTFLVMPHTYRYAALLAAVACTKPIHASMQHVALLCIVRHTRQYKAAAIDMDRT